MSGLSTSESATLEYCAGEPMLEQVRSWASVNSGSHNRAGLARMAALLGDAYSALPGSLRLEDAVAVERMAADGSIERVDHGRNLHLQVRPDAPVQILLTGHMDTVFPEDHPFQTTGWKGEGVLGGPGVADMKGGLAMMLAALKAVERSSAAANLGYEVVINSDEEVGSPGSASLIARAAHGKTAAFTYEPAVLPDGTLAGARPGSGNFSILILGRSAHAGRNPEEGRNAITAAADLTLRLATAARSGLSVNPARIDGGGPNNVVPERAILRVNIRPATLADQHAAETLIETSIAAISSAHDVQVTAHGGFGRPPKPIDPAAARLFAFVRACGTDLGQKIGWKSSGGVCDGNTIAACGVPVIDTMGVRGGAIHSAEEYLIVPSLVERAQLSALALVRLADGEFR